MTTPAFKEWHVIVESLGAGEQILILRKGGIAEGPAGFQVEASRFWLFPTHFHAQLEKTRPDAHRWFQPQAAPPAVELRYFADLTGTRFLPSWDDVQKLAPHHFWTEATVRERFEWDTPNGLHALVVRVHKLITPVSLPFSTDMGGCKSWISVPAIFDAHPSTPVLSDEKFMQQVAALPV